MAQQFIKKRLRAPSTADFPYLSSEDNSSTPTSVDGKCAFIVRTYVDAENAFGAKIRERYIVTVVPDADGETWTLKDLSEY